MFKRLIFLLLFAMAAGHPLLIQNKPLPSSEINSCSSSPYSPHGLNKTPGKRKGFRTPTEKGKVVGRVMGYVFVLVLSLVFLLSGILKAISPGEFKETLLSYGMFPPWMIKMAVIFLPWAEILAGAGLLIPFLRRPAALVLALMNIVFIGILTVALKRGIHAACGCFGTLSREISFRAVLRDTALLAMSLYIYLHFA